MSKAKHTTPAVEETPAQQYARVRAVLRGIDLGTPPQYRQTHPQEFKRLEAAYATLNRQVTYVGAYVSEKDVSADELAAVMVLVGELEQVPETHTTDPAGAFKYTGPTQG